MKNWIVVGRETGLPGVLVVKNPSASARDVRGSGSVLGLGRSPGARHANPFWYSCLEDPMDRGSWWSTVHKVTNRQN